MQRYSSTSNGKPVSQNSNLQRCAIETRLLDQIALVHDTGPDGRITRVNATMCAKTGYSADELIGSSHRIIHPDMAITGSWLELHKYSPDSEMWSGETLNRTKDYSDLWLSTTAAAIRDENGGLLGYCCVSIDVTERKKLYEEFQRNGKLMQLGQLTATVAHEIRNPLGAIRTANYVLERKLNGQVAGVEPQLERINVSIRRCDKIITELLDFSRKKTIKATTLAVDGWLDETVDEVSKTLAAGPHSAGSNVSSELSLGALEASFDPEQMRQVVINLLSNAAEALSEKVKSGTAGPDFQPLIQVKSQSAGDTIQIIVTDNGPGIEPKNIKRIREPLFTTKSYGVGLGISAIEKILQDHQGGLGIESVVGSGSTMTASFNRYTAENPAS